MPVKVRDLTPAVTTTTRRIQVVTALLLGATCLVQGVRLCRVLVVLQGKREVFAQEAANKTAFGRRLDQDRSRLASLEAELDKRLAPIFSDHSAHDEALKSTMALWLVRATALRQLLATHPKWRTPQLELLNENAWLEVASQYDVSLEIDARKALSRLRFEADNSVGLAIYEALRDYLRQSHGAFPTALEDLAPHLRTDISIEMLHQFMINPGAQQSLEGISGRFIVLKSPADPEYDFIWGIGPRGMGALPPENR
jgi:hypothetical protein